MNVITHITKPVVDVRHVRIVALLFISMILFSCASVDPRKTDVTLHPEVPEKKVTSFDDALSQLGKMTQIYGTDLLNIMCRDIYDATGTSVSTGGEVPFEITEMVKTTLNSIGGHVTYIPYNPEKLIILKQAQYSNFSYKRIPHVVITGGITEFDRGLELRGKGYDFGVESQPFKQLPDWSPGNIIGLDYGKEKAESVSRITLDFNMLDFQANAGIARMQTVNTIQVGKGIAESELAFTLFGPTFGVKGNVKKIQGRHAAVRLLVQLSMLQLVGKYFDLPYWRLLPDSEPDPVVVDIVTTDFHNMDEPAKAVKVQELLFMHGYDVPLGKTFNKETHAALKCVDDTYESEKGIDKDLFLRLYFSVPLTHDAMERRYIFNRNLEQFLAALEAEKNVGRKTEPAAAVHDKKKAAKKAQPVGAAKSKEKTIEKDEEFNHILILFENKDKVKLLKHIKSRAGTD